MNKETIGKRVRREREKQALTREAFAEEVGLSPRFLGEIENGTKGMSAETLYRICERTGVSADYLLLGRQSAADARTPAAAMLASIPPGYTEMIEDVLKAFLRTIQAAEARREA